MHDIKVKARSFMERAFFVKKNTEGFAMQRNKTTISLTVNGERRESAAATLAELLQELGLGDGAVVAELNGRIVRQDAFAGTPLSGEDKIELIRFVGGG